MEHRWHDFGYTGICGKDGFPVPGSLMRHYRIKQNLSQEQLAQTLGISRTMVARMENENVGMKDITTLRQVADALDIDPVLLGLASKEERYSQNQAVYDIPMLQQNLKLYREVYFSGGNLGELDHFTLMLQPWIAYSKAISHKNPMLLEILCQYTQLGIDLARDTCTYLGVERYIKWSGFLTSKLKNHTMLAATLMRQCIALYEQGQFQQAQECIDEALEITHLASSVRGGVLREASLVYARLGDVQAMPLLEKARSIARSEQLDDDPGFVRLDLAYCQMAKAQILFEQKKYNDALETLALAEKSISPLLVRRKAELQVLQSEILLRQGFYEVAAGCAQKGLSLVIHLHSPLRLSQLVKIYLEMKKSAFGSSREVHELGVRLRQEVEQDKIPAFLQELMDNDTHHSL